MMNVSDLRWWWRWGRYTPHGRPVGTPENAVLKTESERDAALQRVERLGLPVYDDPPKNWDSLAALTAILARTAPDARVLDAGSVPNAVILPWLALYGYRDLVGINLAIERPFSVGPIRYQRGDITKTDFPDASFDAVTCLSVIEHGVPTDAYLAEMARLLKPGGVLVTSTDYWHAPVDTKGKEAWGAPVRVFERSSIEGMIAKAQSLGLELTGPLELDCSERVVHWKRMDLRYTFVVFTFVRSTNAR